MPDTLIRRTAHARRRLLDTRESRPLTFTEHQRLIHATLLLERLAPVMNRSVRKALAGSRPLWEEPSDTAGNPTSVELEQHRKEMVAIARGFLSPSTRAPETATSLSNGEPQ